MLGLSQTGPKGPMLHVKTRRDGTAIHFYHLASSAQPGKTADSPQT